MVANSLLLCYNNSIEEEIWELFIHVVITLPIKYILVCRLERFLLENKNI